MALLLNIAVGVAGVFIILAGWAAVDILARKQLGERGHGCHGSSHGCGACQALEECQQAQSDPPSPDDAPPS